MRPEVARWLASACADADARGLTQLRPLLEGLARSTNALREADAGPEGPARTNADNDDSAS
jgi:hypothetical protein